LDIRGSLKKRFHHEGKNQQKIMTMNICMAEALVLFIKNSPHFEMVVNNALPDLLILFWGRNNEYRYPLDHMN